MDDPRVECIRDRVYLALNISENDIFEDLLNRDDGEIERILAKFLNETPDSEEAAVLFYKIVQEEEEEVEVECGKFVLHLIKCFFECIFLKAFVR